MVATSTLWERASKYHEPKERLRKLTASSVADNLDQQEASKCVIREYQVTPVALLPVSTTMSTEEKGFYQLLGRCFDNLTHTVSLCSYSA
jgi:hypothetical protein